MGRLDGVGRGEGKGKGGRGVRVPLDIFGVGAEVGRVVYFVFEELCRTVNQVLR